MNKVKIGFICVHNSCRSQMVEAIAKIIAGDVFEAYSSGKETKPHINDDTVAIIKELYNVDMNKTQYSKLIDELPELDIVITMGCNVSYPYLTCKYQEDWGIDDPTGKSREDFMQTAEIIKKKIIDLTSRTGILIN